MACVLTLQHDCRHFQPNGHQCQGTWFCQIWLTDGMSGATIPAPRAVSNNALGEVKPLLSKQEEKRGRRKLAKKAN